MYPQETLKDMAKPYLETKESILVTDDGQFFYDEPEGQTYAKNYAFRQKVKVYRVTSKGLDDTDVLEKVGVNNPGPMESSEDKKAKAKAAKDAEKAIKDAKAQKTKEAAEAEKQEKADKEAKEAAEAKAAAVKEAEAKANSEKEAGKTPAAVKTDEKKGDSNVTK